MYVSAKINTYLLIYKRSRALRPWRWDARNENPGKVRHASQILGRKEQPGWPWSRRDRGRRTAWPSVASNGRGPQAKRSGKDSPEGAYRPDGPCPQATESRLAWPAEERKTPKVYLRTSTRPAEERKPAKAFFGGAGRAAEEGEHEAARQGCCRAVHWRVPPVDKRTTQASGHRSPSPFRRGLWLSPKGTCCSTSTGGQSRNPAGSGRTGG